MVFSPLFPVSATAVRDRVLPGVGAVPVDRVPVGDDAVVGDGGAEPEQQADQQQQRCPPGALHVRRRGALRPGEHPRLFSSALSEPEPEPEPKRIKRSAAAGDQET